MTEEVPRKYSHSKKSEKDEKKLEKVIVGEAIQRKKTLGSKIKETFTGDDAKSVGAYLLFDVFIPQAKNMLADAAAQGAERMLFGDSRGRRSSSSVNRAYTSYGSRYRRDDERPARRELSDRARATHDFREIVLQDRADAEEVLDQLAETIAKYDSVTVADLYQLVGQTTQFTDNNWGWKELRNARVRLVREGYLLDLPSPYPLD